MEPFISQTGIAIPMRFSNIDTGMLGHAQWCRDHPTDFAGGLFHDWRYDTDGRPDPLFILNQDRYKGASIMVAGPNFGCGSSRETAVWALMQYGIRAVIAPSFGEIFRDNGFQNGLLTVLLDEAIVEQIFDRLTQANDPAMTVDLKTCSLAVPGMPEPIPFAITDDRRMALMEGLDETMLIRRSEDDIRAYEERDRTERPWIYHRPPAGTAAAASN